MEPITQVQLDELVDAAARVAAAAPQRAGSLVFAAKIPWVRIERLRRALDDCRIEWREP